MPGYQGVVDGRGDGNERVAERRKEGVRLERGRENGERENGERENGERENAERENANPNPSNSIPTHQTVSSGISPKPLNPTTVPKLCPTKTKDPGSYFPLTYSSTVGRSL